MKDRPTNKQLEEMINQICEADDFDCKESIMSQINSGRTQMRSRWLVLTEEFGLRTTWILAVFTLIGLVNLIVFMISRSPETEFLEFGGSGLGVVAKSFPYGWSALAIALIIFTIVAMKRFSWSYLFPFKLFSFLLVGGVLSAGSVAFATGINDSLYNKLIENPGAGDSLLAKLYCLCANRDLTADNAVMGEILDASSNQLIVQTPKLEIVTIKMTNATEWMDEIAPKTFFTVKALGNKESDDVFTASHIKVHDVQGMDLIRSQEDCQNKQQWERKREIADQRRNAVSQPFTPAMGTAQLVKSIY